MLNITGLGACYFNGEWFPKNYKEAVHYYRLLVDQGNVDARFMLGVCYKNGDGVLMDLKEAIRYYRLAVAQNFAFAIEELKNPIFASFVVSSLSKPLDEKTGALSIILCLLECDVCKKICQPNYCASCEEAKYCSKECQKIAWKTRHTITCHKS